MSEALGEAVPEGLKCSSVTTDTRDLKDGAVFVALNGENFDGHDFLNLALEKGACAAIVDRRLREVDGLHLIHVVDTRLAYGQLATFARREITGPVVAITGSNGKTTTKEMVSAALAAKWEVHSTSKNNNNLVGVPLTILSAPDTTGAMVVEVGASEPGEVARLRDVVEPDIAIITNVFAAHLAGFGSLDGVLEEKIALVRGVELAFVGTHPTDLAARSRIARVVKTVGLEGADITPDSLSAADGRYTIKYGGVSVELPVYGAHQVENAMFALAVSDELGVSLAEVAERLGSVELPPGRTEMIRLGSSMVMHDAYNSNPASLRAALATVQSLRSGRRLVLVVGTMLELGPQSERIHQDALQDVTAINPDVIIAVGEFSKAAKTLSFGGDLILAADADEAGEYLAKLIRGGELILLKGSRGVHLEKVLEYLKTGS
jgi:UDP-N-acetylmuramoyl-tripeptide--D-alanyl-D-alanine ligase